MNEDYDRRAVEYGINTHRREPTRHHEKTPIDDLPRRERSDVFGQKYDRRRDGLRWPGLNAKLQKSVGRPWAKVYHELCEELKTFRGNHDEYRKMIFWHIEVNAIDVGNGIFEAEGRDIYEDVFVHPRTGLICKTDPDWDRKRWRLVGDDSYDKHEVRYIDNGCYRKIGKHWFEVILANVPVVRQEQDYNFPNGSKEGFSLYDVVMKITVNRWYRDVLHRTHGTRTYANKLLPPDKTYRKISENQYTLEGRTIYAKALRQLKEKEIRHLGLGVERKVPDIVR